MGGVGGGGGWGVLENEQGRTKGRGVKTQESWADVLFEYSLRSEQDEGYHEMRKMMWIFKIPIYLPSFKINLTNFIFLQD